MVVRDVLWRVVELSCCICDGSGMYRRRSNGSNKKKQINL